MKKQIMSLILVFAMIMTMIPQTLFAANSDAHLAFRYAGWDEGSPYENKEETLLTELSGKKDYAIEGYFYLIEGEKETRIPSSNISVMNADFAEVSGFDSDLYCTWILPLTYGTTEIIGKVNGETYTMNLECVIPEYGFSKTTELTADTILEDYSVTGVGDVIYYVSNGEYPIDSVELGYGLEKIADYKISDNKKVIEITFKDIPNSGDSYSIYVTYAENEYYFDEIQSVITLYDGTPGLRWRYASWNEDGYYGDPEEDLWMDWLGLPGSENVIFIYYVENGVEEQLTIEDLYVSDTNVVDISSEYMQGAICITNKNFGHATIGYTRNGVEYTLDVNIELPDVAFYSKPVVNTDNYIDSFTVTKDNNTIYLMHKDGYKFDYIDEVFGDYNYDEYVETTISGDQTYIIVEMDEDIPDGYMVVAGVYSVDGESGYYGSADIKIENGKSSLKYHEGYVWNGVFEEDSYLPMKKKWDTKVNDYPLTAQFYMVENGNKTMIPASELYSTNTSVATVTPDSEVPEVAIIEPVGVGQADICYKVDGVTYSVNVDVILPDFGTYSSSVANEDTYIDKFVYNDEQDTFYFVARNGWELADVRLDDMLAEVAEVTIDSSTRTFATIKITGNISDFHTYISYDAVNSETQETIEDWGYGFEIENGKPALKYTIGYLVDEELVEMDEYGYMDRYYSMKGEVSYVYLYHVDNGVGTRVTYDQVTSSDESILKIKECAQDANATVFEVVGFGEAKIEYELNGETYSFRLSSELPGSGFFSTTDFTEETYITEFGVTETNKTFYLLMSYDEYFSEVTLSGDVAECVEAKILDNPQIVEMTITGEIEDEEKLYVNAIVDSQVYDYSYEINYEITLYNGEAEELYYAPHYDSANGTITGIEVGDEVNIGTVFDASNIGDANQIYLYFKSYEGEDTGSYGFEYVIPGQQFVFNGALINCDDKDGYYVSNVEFDERAETIRITCVCNVAPTIVPKVNISLEWDKFVDFKDGEAIPSYKETTSVSGEGIYKGFTSSLMFKVKEEHVEKGYITEYQYEMANNYMNGWWEVESADESYVFSKNDEYRLLLEVFASTGYVFAYDSSADVSDRVVLDDDDVTLTGTSLYWGEFQNMGLNVWIEIGTGEQIIEKAKPVLSDGWHYIDGDWYYYEDNQKVCNTWRLDSKGWCFLGEDGAMLYNQWVKDSKGWCFVDSSGYMVYSKWCKDDTDWAYAGADGYRQTSKWIKDSVGWCYVDEKGYMVYNQWVADSKGYVYVDDSGYMVTSEWIETSEGWCYVGTGGYKTTNKWMKKDGNWCYLGADGYLVTNDWAKDGSRWCYLDENGFMTKDEWINDGSGTCYLDASGYLVTNKWLKVDGEWVYVGNSGYMVVSAWAKDSKGWCYLDENGHMVYDSWVADSKGLCYVGADGYMVTNKWVKDNGEWCYVGSDGYKVTSKWVKDSVSWCYVDEEGFMVYNQWVKDSVGFCYVDASGYMVYDQWVEIDSEKYYVNESGYRIENAWKKIDGLWYYFKEGGVMAKDETIGNDEFDENGVWVS